MEYLITFILSVGASVVGYYICKWLDGQSKFTASITKILPAPCRSKERQNDRKCIDYCAVVENCEYGICLKNTLELTS